MTPGGEGGMGMGAKWAWGQKGSMRDSVALDVFRVLTVPAAISRS